MAVGRSTRATSLEAAMARHPSAQQRAPAQPGVPWSATLLQPVTARVDSVQPIMVRVGGPIPVEALPVHIGVEIRGGGQQRWQPAQWRDGVAVASLGAAGLRVPAGRYRALVKVDAGTDTPVLDAGSLIVT